MQTTPTPYRNQPKSIISIIAYLNLSFVLGIIYFVLLVTGISVGVSTFIIWIGLPLLIGTFAMIRGIGVIERAMAREMLGVRIREPRPRSYPSGKNLWRRGFSNLTDAFTWKSFLYILLKFPMGIISFCVSTTFLATTLGLLLAPLGYAIATFVLQINGIHLQNDTPVWLIPINIDITGDFNGLMFIKSFLYTGVGIAFWFLTQAILRGMGQVSGELARAFLSPSHEELHQPFQPVASSAERFAPNHEHSYEYGYMPEYRGSQDDTLPGTVYQEPSGPYMEGPIQYQR